MGNGGRGSTRIRSTCGEGAGWQGRHRFQEGAWAGSSGSPRPVACRQGACNVAVGSASKPSEEREEISPELLDRVRARDEAASRELVERLHPLVARVVRGHLGHRDEPEDLMQEVYLKVFTRLDQYRGEMPLAHWVSRIALNTCLDRLRRQKARPELRWSDLSEAEQELLRQTPSEEAATSVELNSSRELIERLLAGLSERDAWLIREVELVGRTIAEVCRQTGWNAGVTRIRAFRARRRLKALFEELEESR